MNNFFSEIKNSYKSGNGFIKLLYINLSLFIIYTAIWVPYPEIKNIITHIAFPSETEILIHKPWTFISYMFIHTDPLHLLSNMLFLYFGSKLFLQNFSDKQLITTYILGGICGAIFFTLLFNIFPDYPAFETKKPLIGASAGVFAIMIASATYRPNYLIHLPFIGSVKLKHIAWTAIILFYIGIGNSAHPGGHIAHLGGAIFGHLYIKQLKKKKYLSSNLFRSLKKIFNIFTKRENINKVHRRTKSDYQFNSEKAKQQKEIDNILEKIAKSGYESLSKKEKTTLFSQSKK